MVKAAAGKGGSSIWNVFSLIRAAFTLKGTVSITLILICIMFVSAIAASIDQKSLMPFVTKVGGELLNHDNKLYIEAVNMEEAGGLFVKTDDGEGGFVKGVKRIWFTIKSLLRVLVNIWYLWTFAFLFYKLAIIITNNSSATTSNIFLMILFLVILQVGANLLDVERWEVNQNDDKYEFTTKQKLVPFKGLYKFATVAPALFNPVYGDGNQTISNITLTDNSTVTTDDGLVKSINMLWEADSNETKA